ncbi:MAG: NAD(P)/FAD-dependent oxidoreductase [bacterium]|nr:NAD(P)/FAD-dependent oxidoreductase [bacterium]
MVQRYDVAIIGTGPAGLSAAITLKIRNKNIILFGSRKLSDKLLKAQEIQNYLGMASVSGSQLAEQFHNHLEQMDIAITEEQITSAYAMGDYYSMISKTNEIYEAKALIIASGVSFARPYPGEEQFLGRGVSYCATCDAPLYKNKTVAIVASSKKEEAEAQFLAELCEKVYYVPLYKDEVLLPENVEIVRDVPVSVTGGLKVEKLVLKNREIAADGIFILRDSVMPSQLLSGLAMEENHVIVNRNMETNLPGCFACGDIVGQPYQYIKAAGEGNVAALSAVKYLG